MRSFTAATAAAALLLANTATARAETITIVQDSRHVQALAHVNDPNGDDLKQDQATGQNVMGFSLPVTTGTSSGIAAVALTSSLMDPLRLAGTGTASISYESTRWTEFSSSAEYAVMFNATAPVDYVFQGTFSAASSEQTPDPTSTHRGNWGAFLKGLGGSAGSDYMFSAYGIGPESRTFAGRLVPGLYFIDVTGIAGAFTHLNLGSRGSGHAGFDFALNFTPASSPAPVPEPASLLLVGGGMIALTRRFRRG